LPAPRRRGAAPALLLGTALLLSSALGPAALAQGGGGGPRIAAVVNEAVITTGDLNDRVGLVTATAGVPDDPEVRRRLSQQVLRGFIDEKLQLQEADRLGLKVTDAEIDQTMTVLAQRNRLDLAAFKQALAERGIPERVLRAQLRGQLSWAKVVNRELRPRVAVTAEQVEQALREAAAGGGEVELLLSELLLPLDSADDEARVLREAQGLAATLRDGGDFAALARQVSVASSAKDGGEIGWVRPATMLPELRPRILPLAAGGVSDPIATPAGVHIFKVRERRSPGESPGKRLVVTKSRWPRSSCPSPPPPSPPDAQGKGVAEAGWGRLGGRGGRNGGGGPGKARS
jgi:peptidyl-prolyl cis-trans isomerase SurA